MTAMLVTCSSCQTEFELDPAKVPAAGVRARCSVCSAVINVPAHDPATSTGAATTGAASGAGQPEHATESSPVVEEARADTQERDEAQPAHAEPAHVEPPHVEPPHVEPPHVEPPHVEPPHVEPPHVEPPHVEPPHVEPPHVEPPHVEPPHVEPPHAEPTQRRPINPFLTRDPALRAKRLARALVSDIVAYHPARHAEGLRDGTLKTLFRDEIKKSYEEYVDQVGRDFASSTTHFQDALNDVLASGKKLF